MCFGTIKDECATDAIEISDGLRCILNDASFVRSTIRDECATEDIKIPI